jgi:HlyD family secretion protein
MRIRTLLIVLVALAAAGAATFVLRRGPTPTPVDTAVVARVASLQSFVTASGELVAARSADIGSSVMGRLVRLHVKEGDRVRPGQLLAVIDPEQAASTAAGASAGAMAAEADARAATEQWQAAQAEAVAAEARAAEAERALARARSLEADGLVAKADADAATAAADATRAQAAAARAAVLGARQSGDAATQRVAQARADARRARDGLSKTRIEAPIAGVVTRLEAEEGEMVVMGVQNQPGTILMTIADLSGMNAEVKVSEADVLRVSVDDPATVTLDALPGQSFRGRVTDIGASALPPVGTQAAAREFKTIVQLDQPGPLRPGLTCDVEVLVDERRNVLTVPLQALVERDTPEGRRTGVFVVTDERARFTPLARVGIIGGLSVEVEGVPEGATIVAGPIQTLRDLPDESPVVRSTPER